MDVFVGREAELRLLEDIYPKSSNCGFAIPFFSSRSNRRNVICGDSKTGKTTLVRKFYKIMQDKYKYALFGTGIRNFLHDNRYVYDRSSGAIFWLSGLRNLDDQYRYVATDILGLTRDDESDTHNYRDVVFDWMNYNTNWIIIIDDVENSDIIKEYLPPPTILGHAIIITRSSKEQLIKDEFYHSVNIIELSHLDLESIFWKCCNRTDDLLTHEDKRIGRELCAKLHNNPNKIKSIGYHIRDHCMDIGEYILRLQSIEKEWKDFILEKGGNGDIIIGLEKFGVESLYHLNILRDTRKDYYDMKEFSKLLSPTQIEIMLTILESGVPKSAFEYTPV
jgi:GTPase SAR1 family protein